MTEVALHLHQTAQPDVYSKYPQHVKHSYAEPKQDENAALVGIHHCTSSETSD
jgi:hypothetical protein